MIVAVMSSGRRSLREPLKARPMGERAVETITASGITAPNKKGWRVAPPWWGGGGVWGGRRGAAGCGVRARGRKKGRGGDGRLVEGRWSGGGWEYESVLRSSGRG